MTSTETNKEIIYKIILIGTAAAGKTSLISVGTGKDDFDPKTVVPTLAPEFLKSTSSCHATAHPGRFNLFL